MDAVVVSHNSTADLEGLLECQPLRRAFSRLILVDNASTDGSPEMAERAGVEVLRRAANDGFAAAVNEGVGRTDGSLVAVLNPDIRFETDDITSRLAEHFVKPRVGLLAPALVLPDGTLQDSAREVPMPIDLFLRRWGRRAHGSVNPETATVVPWVVGACIVLRRSAFDDVGGLDERFLLYFEDVDLCVRLRDRGWDVVVDPTVTVSHYHRAASRRSLLGWSTRQHIRSALRFYREHPRYLVSRPRGHPPAQSDAV
jgi:N-acetylglucosaminyl-diphospho-decaprenol L-rhamnosyltransferase